MMSNGSDTTYTISIAGRVITLTPSTGAAQTITVPDDLDMGFDSGGADGDKELRFVVQELAPSGKRDFSVTLASTGSRREPSYSFVAGSGTGSITSSSDPGGIVRSVLYIGRGNIAFVPDDREKFRFQFKEAARKNRSLSGAKLVVNGTEHDVEDWGISSDRRYREVRTSDDVTYAYRSGRAVTFNLKFADGTYLGYTSETKATRTLLKEEMKGALGITDVRENVTSVLQDATDAAATTSGEAAVTVSVPFDFHTVYDDAGMSPVYDATTKRMRFEGLSRSEKTSVAVRSNVRLRHNGGECSVELSLREFRGAAETGRWVLARRDLEESGTLFAFDLAGETAEAEMSDGRYYRFDVDAKRSGDANATVGVHGTSAHVINFASFERVEGDRVWSPTEKLAWPPNQKASVRLVRDEEESGANTTGYFFADDEAEAELFFGREWKGVIGAGNARVKFDVSYSGKSGSFRSPYDFKVAGSWVLSDGTALDWEEKLTVSATAASGSETLTFTPPSTATGMYLRYVRETNTFTASTDEITFAAGDVEISYVSGGSTTVPDATAEVKGKVELATTAEATAGTDATRAVTPAGLKAATDALSIPSAPADASVSAKGIAEIATAAEADAGTDSGRIMTPALVARLVGAGRKGGTSLPAGPVAPNYFVLTARDGTNEPGLYVCSVNGTWTRAMSMVSSDRTLSGDGAGNKLGLSEAEKKRMDASYDFLRGTLLEAMLTSGNSSDSTARGYADMAEGSSDGRNNVAFGSMDDATFTAGGNEYKVLALEQETGGDRAVVVKFGLNSSAALTPPALPETLDLRIGNTTLRQRDAAVSAPKDKVLNRNGSIKDAAYIEWKFAGAPSGLIPAPASGAGGKAAIKILGEDVDADGVVPDASDTARGKIEIATQAEVNALSDTTRAVTPGRLPEASATQKGLVELADEAVADAGADNKSAMTPALVKRRIEAFGNALRATTTLVAGKSLTFALSNAAEDTGTDIPDAAEDRKVEVSVAAPAGSATFLLADLLAKPAVSASAQLADSNSLSFDSDDSSAKYRLARGGNGNFFFASDTNGTYAVTIKDNRVFVESDKLPRASGTRAGIISAADYDRIHSSIDGAHLEDAPKLTEALLRDDDEILIHDASVTQGSRLKEITISEFKKVIARVRDGITGATVKGKLEGLSGNDRLAASAIKGLPSGGSSSTSAGYKVLARGASPSSTWQRVGSGHVLTAGKLILAGSYTSGRDAETLNIPSDDLLALTAATVGSNSRSSNAYVKIADSLVYLGRDSANNLLIIEAGSPDPTRYWVVEIESGGEAASPRGAKIAELALPTAPGTANTPISNAWVVESAYAKASRYNARQSGSSLDMPKVLSDNVVGYVICAMVGNTEVQCGYLPWGPLTIDGQNRGWQGSNINWTMPFPTSTDRTRRNVNIVIQRNFTSRHLDALHVYSGGDTIQANAKIVLYEWLCAVGAKGEKGDKGDPGTGGGKVVGTGALPSSMTGRSAGDLWFVPHDGFYEAVAATGKSATISIAGLVPSQDGDDYTLPVATLTGFRNLIADNGGISAQATTGTFGKDGFDIVVGDDHYYMAYDSTVNNVDQFFATDVNGLAWTTSAIAANSYIHSRSTEPFTAAGLQWSKAFSHGGPVKSVADPLEIDSAGQLSLAPAGLADGDSIDPDDGILWREGEGDQEFYTAGIQATRKALGITGAVDSGNTFPATPKVGQRFILLREEAQTDTRLVSVAQVNATTRRIYFNVPSAVFFASLTANSSAHTTAVLRNKVVLTFAVLGGSFSNNVKKVVFYEETGASATYTVASASVSSSLPYTFQVNGLNYASLDPAKKYRVNFEFNNGSKLYPDITYAPGDYGYTGYPTSPPWELTPGVAAAWATQGRPEPRTLLAVTKLIDGAATGLVTTGADKRNNLTTFNPTFDLDDADKQAGAIEVEAHLSFTARSSNMIGFGSDRKQTISLTDFTFASTMRASTAWAAAANNGEQVGSNVEVYAGSVKIGTLSLWVAKNAANELGYYLAYDSDNSRYNFTVGMTMNAAFVHNDPPSTSSNGITNLLNNHNIGNVGSLYVDTTLNISQIGAGRSLIITLCVENSSADRSDCNISTAVLPYELLNDLPINREGVSRSAHGDYLVAGSRTLSIVKSSEGKILIVTHEQVLLRVKISAWKI